MNLIVYRALTIKTTFTEAEILNRLSSNIEKQPESFAFKRLKSDKFFMGKLENNKFKIHQIIKGRNSFIPIIQGHITRNTTGCDIKIKMRLHLAVILILLWMITFVFYSMWKKNAYDGFIFIGFLSAMTIFCFNQECNRSIEELRDILEPTANNT